MRINFSISPVAVVHGGRGLCGSWELPETTETVLYPGDRLMFHSCAKMVMYIYIYNNNIYIYDVT